MIRSIQRRTASLLFIALCPPWAMSAWAALGGAAGVEADTGLHGTVTSTALMHYDIDEISDDSGMRVREYVNRAGTVFAVAWSGPVAPDLRPLLGVHFPMYASALAALDHPGLHRSLRVESAALIVESGGHLRAYFGRAYLPSLVPAGVSAAELR